MTECLPDLPRYIRQRYNEWQGADHPNGPWHPIPAPQSGLPWKTDGPAVQSREPASVAAEFTGQPPALAAPDVEEVAELVAVLLADAKRLTAERPDLMQLTSQQLTRAATLLQQLDEEADQ
jgi:hypothetical protein